MGDARRPLHETAALVEDIVHTQLITMVGRHSCSFSLREKFLHFYFTFCAITAPQKLHQACEGAVLRGSRVISAEDILFLMRRDKVEFILKKKTNRKNTI